jgi:hypothetical protein
MNKQADFFVVKASPPARPIATPIVIWGPLPFGATLACPIMRQHHLEPNTIVDKLMSPPSRGATNGHVGTRCHVEFKRWDQHVSDSMAESILKCDGLGYSVAGYH